MYSLNFSTMCGTFEPIHDCLKQHSNAYFNVVTQMNWSVHCLSQPSVKATLIQQGGHEHVWSKSPDMLLLEGLQLLERACWQLHPHLIASVHTAAL